MKKIAFLLVMALAFFSLDTQARSQKYRMKKDLSTIYIPSALKLYEQNNQVDVKFEVGFPKKFIGKNERYVLTPVLTDYHNVMPLSSLVIDGKRFGKRGATKEIAERDANNYPNAIHMPATRQSRVITYQEIVPFMPWMINSDLVVTEKFDTRKETVVVAEVIYAKGVTVVKKPKPAKQTMMIKEINTKEGRVNVNFMVNSSKIDMTLDNNTRELLQLRTLLENVMNDPAIKVDSITLIASSSPEGPYDFNKKLTVARAEAVKDYLVQNLNVPKDKLNLIKTNDITENWAGLAALAAEAKVPNLDRVMKALNTTDLNAREKAMKSLPEYPFIRKNLLPQLRYVTYQVYYSTQSCKEVPVTACDTPCPADKPMKPVATKPAQTTQSQQWTAPVQVEKVKVKASNDLKKEEKMLKKAAKEEAKMMKKEAKKAKAAASKAEKEMKKAAKKAAKAVKDTEKAAKDIA